MSGLLFLSSSDFYLQKTEKGPVLSVSIPGFSLILYYSTSCNFCGSYINIFKNLPRGISGCQIGIINIGKEKKVVEMSKNSISRLVFVPYITFCYNGIPMAEYTGEPKEELLKKFILDMASNIQKKQSALQGSQQNGRDGRENKERKEQGRPDENPKIPPYSMGIPVSGDKRSEVCYLEQSKAYAPVTK